MLGMFPGPASREGDVGHSSENAHASQACSAGSWALAAAELGRFMHASSLQEILQCAGVSLDRTTRSIDAESSCPTGTANGGPDADVVRRGESPRPSRASRESRARQLTP